MQTRTVAVANEKGGVGKTVTVINLGDALSVLKQKVLIVDMDPQANATKGLGVEVPEGTPTVYDLLGPEASAGADEAIVRTRWSGLDLLPSHVDLSGAEVELTEVEGRENRLKEALAELPGDYDFILLDTPPSLSLLTVNVFAYARHVLVPCQTHPFAFAALEELFDTIEAVKEAINPEIAILGIVPTFYDSRTRVSQRIMEQLQADARYRDLLFKTAVRANTTIAESAEVGRPVVFYRKNKTRLDFIVPAGAGDAAVGRFLGREIAVSKLDDFKFLLENTVEIPLKRGAKVFGLRCPKPSAFVLHKCATFTDRDDPQKKAKDLYYAYFVLRHTPGPEELLTELRAYAGEPLYKKAAANIKTYFSSETSRGCVMVEKEHGPDAYIEDLSADIFRRFKSAFCDRLEKEQG
ncbi:MAG: AAA family ATPase [Desulfatitalea sp.]|nr:AAA family ATPase [Desulfatitalea sp.]